MPCYDPPWRNDDYPRRDDSEELGEKRRRCHELTAMLCAVMHTIEGSADVILKNQILELKGTAGPTGMIPYNVRLWWEGHKEFDRERRS
jgi:hypothetical protein